MTFLQIVLCVLVAAPFAFVGLIYGLLCLLDTVFYPRAIKEFKKLGLPHTNEAIASFDKARKADQKVCIYDATAPLVMLIALLFTPKSAEKLPKLFRKWDNDVSINGDGYGWQRADGSWVDLRDGVEHLGEPLVSYQDPAYGGTAYYAKGHHPRSYWARYIWLGWKNRASKLYLEQGIQVNKADIDILSGSLDIGTRKEGHFFLKHWSDYHYKSVKKYGPFVVIKSLGYKLEIRFKSDKPSGTAAAVLIPFSMKGWKGN